MSKKKIWIWNHYATNMFFDEGGRHYWFAHYLQKEGYEPTIFCASTIHNSDKIVNTKNQNYLRDEKNGIPFVFVKTPPYKGNGKSRVMNMLSFYRRLFSTTKKYAEEHGKPDVILASSVHPLTLVAGIKIAKKFGVPCICEVRDLWPESLIAYGSLKRHSLLARMLYRGEKWIYKRADRIIMTWEGGSQYIKDQGWDKIINLEKVEHVSNGVMLESFDRNAEENAVVDSDLDNNNYKNLVYAGSIRKVNNLGLLLDSAKIIQEQDQKIRLIIYGSGDQVEHLEQRCRQENIYNVIFKGRVEKNMVPSILKKSYANVLHNSSTSLDKYGQSQNKFFEYLAAGRCIIQTYSVGYSLIEQYACGVCAWKQTPEEIASVILDICNNEDNAIRMGDNARKAAVEFDFQVITQKIINCINK